MNLSTSPSSAAAPGRVNDPWTDLYAVVCAGSAGVHATLVPPHATESATLALAFAGSAALLAVAAVAQVVAPSREGVLAGAALLLAVATAYLLSRTTGIPGLTDHTEPFDALGVVTTSLEVAAAVGVLRHLSRRH